MQVYYIFLHSVNSQLLLRFYINHCVTTLFTTNCMSGMPIQLVSPVSL